MNATQTTATHPPDPTTKLLLAVVAAALSVLALRPLLTPSVAVAAPGAGGAASGTITVIGPTTSGSTTAFVVWNGKVTVIQNVYNQNRKKSEWNAVGVVPLK